MRLTDTAITLSWTVNDVMRCFPISALVLNNLGVDTCCGANDALDLAAKKAGLLPEALLAALIPCSTDDEADTDIRAHEVPPRGGCHHAQTA